MGAGASSAAAPHLSEAFEILGGALNDCMVAALNDKEPDEGELKALQEKYQEALKKSFDHHDTKKDQKLDKDETAVFLSHLVGASSGFVEASVKVMTTMMLQQMLKGMKEDLSGIDAVKDALPELGKICEDEMQKGQAKIMQSLEEKKTDYLANQEERNAKAMAIVDKDGSGCLSLDEFMDMMNMESEAHASLMKSLGFELNPEEYACELTTQELEKKIGEFLEAKMNAAAAAEE